VPGQDPVLERHHILFAGVDGEVVAETNAQLRHDRAEHEVVPFLAAEDLPISQVALIYHLPLFV
jgi:hypothetical protein